MKEKEKSKGKKASKTLTTSFFKKILSSPTVFPTTKTGDGSTFQHYPRVSGLTSTVASSLEPHKPSSFEPSFDKENPRKSLSKSEIIAITLGSVIGVTIIVLLLAIAVILYRKSKPVSDAKPELAQEKREPVHRPPAPFPRNDEPNVYEYIRESDLLEFQRDITGVYNTPGESTVTLDKHNYGTFHDTTDISSSNSLDLVGPVMEESDFKTSTTAAATATTWQPKTPTEEHVYLVLEPP